MTSYVVDTSVVIEKVVSKLIRDKQIKGNIIVPHAVVAELEHQANRGLEIGFLGLEELQEIRRLAEDKKITMEFSGKRPTESQIKYAKSGEIDASIREIAYSEKATLITADKVLSESAKVFGIEIKYIEPKQPKEKIEIEKFFDEHTMSVHLKENCFAFGKKGKPGSWVLETINKKKLTSEEIKNIAKEVVEKSRVDPGSFVEISKSGFTIVQYKNYRIVIVKPPVSDGWEITAVRPLKKLSIEDYKLSEILFKRIKETSRGIVIAGEPGSGKSTFATALAEFYIKEKKITKTVESPRDLLVSDDITQYSKNFTSSQDMHDILFLSRPDNIIFDEMRDTPDFQLYIDIRLAGANLVGVLHSASPIDAIQRFISRMEVGMIPSVLDTILFIEGGKISKVYVLKMSVKVPTGMMEADLARPVVEVRDFANSKLEYEIYSYGEETVVVPVESEKKDNSIRKLATKAIEKEFRRYSDEVKVDVISDNKAVVYIPEENIARVIGKNGVMIEKIENDLGIGIDIQELKFEKGKIGFDIKDDKNHVRIYTEPGRDIDICVDGTFLFSAIASKKGEINIHKKSKLGRDLLNALNSKRKIELKG